MDIDECVSQPDAGKKPQIPSSPKKLDYEEEIKPVEVKREIATQQISEQDIISGWETIKNNDTTLNQSIAVVDFDNSELPLTKVGDDQVNITP